MQFGVNLPNTGIGGDVHTLVVLARDAEAAGWDGVFVWDAIYIDRTLDPHAGTTSDPWIALAAIAVATERVRIGTMITPLSRRRPWKVARETTTLDHLSHGRLVLPVGLGAMDDGGFSSVNEPTDRRERAARLDESLAIIAGLWSGERFGYDGTHYQMQPMQFVPVPVQQPRIPIWVVGAWGRSASMRRALRWDGILPAKQGGDGSYAGMTVDDLRDLAAYVAVHREAETPYDIVVEGALPADSVAAAETVASLTEAGVTWWLESVWTTHDLAALRERIRRVPPR